MLYGLMYSGGVDSIVCLKMLKEQNITPVLFHVSYKETRKYLPIIKRTAKLLSPNSEFYVWEGEDYKASIPNPSKPEYKIHFDKKRKKRSEVFSSFVDMLVVGYWKKDNSSMKIGIEIFRRSKSNVVFPLANMTKKEINKMWKTLPKEIKTNTISTSREMGEWVTVYE